MRWVIQQIDNYSRGWNSLFLWNVKYSISVRFKNKFLVKNLFKPILLVFHFARNVLILQLLFLNCNWWKELTFKFPAGLEDAKRHQYMLFVLLTEWIGDIFCGKLVFQRFSLVPEASCRFKLSVFCSLYATCLA